MPTHRTEKEKAEILKRINARNKAGESIKDIAKDEGITGAQFYAWGGKRSRKEKKALTVKTRSAPTYQALEVKSVPDLAPTTESPLTFTFSGSPQAFADLLRQLKG